MPSELGPSRQLPRPSDVTLRVFLTAPDASNGLQPSICVVAERLGWAAAMPATSATAAGATDRNRRLLTVVSLLPGSAGARDLRTVQGTSGWVAGVVGVTTASR